MKKGKYLAGIVFVALLVVSFGYHLFSFQKQLAIVKTNAQQTERNPLYEQEYGELQSIETRGQSLLSFQDPECIIHYQHATIVVDASGAHVQ